MRYLVGEKIDEIQIAYVEIDRKLSMLLSDAIELSDSLTDERAKNYCRYGLGRRILHIKNCLSRFSEIFEIEKEGNEVPDVHRFNQSAFLNYFFLSISGGMDNLAWIFAFETSLHELKRMEVSLTSDKLKANLPSSLIDLVNKHLDWSSNLKSFRDPAAHRIPPYVVPHLIFADGTQCHDSYFTHDFSESNLVPLHPQVIADAGAFFEIINGGFESLMKLKQ